MIKLISSSQNEGQEAFPILYFCTVCWIFFLEEHIQFLKYLKGISI